MGKVQSKNVILTFDAIKQKATQFYWETENNERQLQGNHGHVVISVLRRLSWM